jgi:hypothetical protein
VSMHTTTTAGPPARPSPYIAVGNGWTLSVRVRGFGLWSREPGQVSLTYAVYKQPGKDYHVTIDSAFIARPGDPNPVADLGIHVSSNDAISGKKLHWPNQDPAPLSVAQQNWMQLHNNAGQFNALIAAFENRMRLCAANVRSSRDYDQAMAAYSAQRFAEATGRRTAKAGYREDLADWVAALPPEVYQDAFQYKAERYFLDHDRAVVVRLDMLRLVKSGDGLNDGFINLCQSITGTVTPLTGQHWRQLSDGLVLLRVWSVEGGGGKEFAMLKSDFDACSPADALLSQDQVLEKAVEAWTQQVAVGPACAQVAFDRTIMNITGPDDRRFHLKVRDLLDIGGLTRLGLSLAMNHTAELPLFFDLPGVYPVSAVADLQAKLPPALRISRAPQADMYAMPEVLVEDWSAELAKATSVVPATLATSLVSGGAWCQVYAENLLVGDRADMIVYLWQGNGARALYVGPKDDVVPGAQVAPSGAVNMGEHVSRLKSYFNGGLSSTVVARSPDDVLVVCSASKKPLQPLIFVDRSALVLLDLDSARVGFAVKQREREEAEKAEAARAKVVALEAFKEYADAWKLIEPQLKQSRRATLLLFALNGELMAVQEGSEKAGVLKAAQAVLLDRLSIEQQDKKSSQALHRMLRIQYGNSKSEGWVGQLANYIGQEKPDLPGTFKGYLVTCKQG